MTNLFTNDAPFNAPDEYNRGYKTWGDYLQDEAENGLLLTCPACNHTVFIWLDCRRGDLDRDCVMCGHSHKEVVRGLLRETERQINKSVDMSRRLVPQYAITFPFYQHPQLATDLYERRRLEKYVTRRQKIRSRFNFRKAWRGLINTIDEDTIRPFMN